MTSLSRCLSRPRALAAGVRAMMHCRSEIRGWGKAYLQRMRVNVPDNVDWLVVPNETMNVFSRRMAAPGGG